MSEAVAPSPLEKCDFGAIHGGKLARPNAGAKRVRGDGLGPDYLAGVLLFALGIHAVNHRGRSHHGGRRRTFSMFPSAP